jgi:hypothetical protein
MGGFIISPLPGSGLFLGRAPEIEEIKPIVGRAPAIALQDGGVADNRRLYRRLGAWRLRFHDPARNEYF